MKKITIDDLARMVADGFSKTASKDDLKDGLAGLKKELTEKIDGVENRLTKRIDEVDGDVKTIKSLVSSNRIDRLEDSMRQVKIILKIH